MNKVFSVLYIKMLYWSSHRYAPYYLASVSFAESSFFPIPPDVMLISMGLAKPTHSWRYVFIAMLFSVLGGIFGYLIGYFGMELIEPYLMSSSYASTVTEVMAWFDKQGVWVVILAGFTPFPYKIFTITAGMMHMAFWPFLIGSIIGRGLRFFLVSGLLYFFGAKIEPLMRKHVDRIAWVVLLLAGIVYWVVSRHYN